MSDVSSDKTANKRRVRRNRSIYAVHYNLQRPHDEVMVPLALHIQAYELQVAGHTNDDHTKYLGLLQCNNGTILKPILKEAQRREIDFYERVYRSTDRDVIELKSSISRYFGCRKFTYNGYEQEYIILEDLSERLLEPCIMDVKIGKRTWDPLASDAKIKSEQTKYGACKQQYGFCIPGFQVYRTSTGKLHKYNKDYGKKLHGNAVKMALRNFLNGIGTPMCRSLLLQFLSKLWKIQQWARSQTALRLYSTSLLLVYDAAKLRECCGDPADGAICVPRSNCRGSPQTLPRRRSNSLHTVGSNFSGQLSPKGPIYKKLNPVPLAPLTLAQTSFTNTSPPINSPWNDALQKISVTHSPDHNYEEKLCKIKMNYRATLDLLTSESPTPNAFGTVKIIDFAHAFFNEEEERALDDNFREGIDNFVELFEGFLRETDDQVN